MVGSFAPIHDGHIDAAFSATRALINNGSHISSLVYTPNSAEYVRRKLGDDEAGWHYKLRVEEILNRGSHPTIDTFVDDVSGPQVGLGEMNEQVLSTVGLYLGSQSCRTHLVVGSDQLLSMESHIAETRNRAVCVLRPGRTDDLAEKMLISWISKAIDSGRLIIATRSNMLEDVSSTMIRRG
jgi:nicotinic acid mononucleotide adenylyltransferase